MSFLLGHCNVFSNKCEGQVESKMYSVLDLSLVMETGICPARLKRTKDASSKVDKP